jgi:hypothetical protein
MVHEMVIYLSENKGKNKILQLLKILMSRFLENFGIVVGFDT